MHAKLTVFFEDPFWVGVFEKLDEGLLETSRVVFGAEPKDAELFDFILNRYHRLWFSRPVVAREGSEKQVNPKRLQRNARLETSSHGVGTKAQQAIKLEQEAHKRERKKTGKENREALEERKFKMKQEKKKEKKKGH